MVTGCRLGLLQLLWERLRVLLNGVVGMDGCHLGLLPMLRVLLRLLRLGKRKMIGLRLVNLLHR